MSGRRSTKAAVADRLGLSRLGNNVDSARFAAICTGLIVVLTAILVGPILLGEKAQDWTAYAQAADRLRSGAPLYVWTLTDPTQQYFLYPPAMAAFWAVGMTPGLLVGLKLVALLGVAALATLPGLGPGGWLTGAAGTFLYVVALLSPPVLHDMVLGNVMTLYLGAVSLSVARRGWLGATALGAVLAIAAKPFIGPYLLWLAVRRPRDAGRTVAAAVAVSAVVALAIGPGRYVDYLQALPKMAVLATPFNGNMGLSGISDPLAVAGLVTAYLVTVVAAIRLPLAPSLIVALTMCLFAQPTIGMAYSVVLFPAIALLWSIARRAGLLMAVLSPVTILVSPLLTAIGVAGLATRSGLRPAARAASSPEMGLSEGVR